MEFELVDGMSVSNVVFGALILDRIKDSYHSTIPSSSQYRITGRYVIRPSTCIETLVSL